MNEGQDEQPEDENGAAWSEARTHHDLRNHGG
jgi:hypothetical protein